MHALVKDLGYLPAAIKMAGVMLRNHKEMSITELRSSWATVIASGEHAAHADRDYPQFMGSLFELAFTKLGLHKIDQSDCRFLLFIVSLWDSPKLDSNQVSILTSALSTPTAKRLTKLTEKLRTVGLWGQDEETLSHRLTIAPAQRVSLSQMFPSTQRGANLVFNNFLKLLGKSGSQHTLVNAVKLVEKMKELHIADVVTYNTLLNLFVDRLTNVVREEQALKLFAAMETNGVSPDAYCYNTMIKLFARSNQQKEVMLWFRRMKKAGVLPDAVSYNTVIHHLVKQGDNKAFVWFDKMIAAGLRPDTYTYSSMIQAYCEAGNVKTAIALKDSMTANGVAPDAYTYSLIIKAYQHSGEDVAGCIQHLFEEMIHNGVEITVVLWQQLKQSCSLEVCKKFEELGLDRNKAPEEPPKAPHWYHTGGGVGGCHNGARRHGHSLGGRSTKGENWRPATQVPTLYSLQCECEGRGAVTCKVCLKKIISV